MSRIGGRQVMSAERCHGTRLRALGAFTILRHETHLVTDSEPLEAAIGDAVAVKIDLGAVAGLDEAAIVIGKEACDPAVITDRMQLHVAARFANVIFEQSASCIEGIANCDIGIVMRMTGCRIAADDDLAARNDQVDPHLEQVALQMARVPAFDDDMAGDDPVAEAYEVLGASADPGREGFGGVHVTKRDLKRQLHSILPPGTPPYRARRQHPALIQIITETAPGSQNGKAVDMDQRRTAATR